MLLAVFTILILALVIVATWPDNGSGGHGY